MKIYMGRSGCSFTIDLSSSLVVEGSYNFWDFLNSDGLRGGAGSGSGLRVSQRHLCQTLQAVAAELAEDAGEEVGEGLLHDVSADDVGVGGWVGLNARLGDVDDGAILLEEVHLTDVGKLRKTQSLERLLEARLIAPLFLP